MAAVALTATQIAVVDGLNNRINPYIANVALTAGDPVYLMTTGKVALADANAAGLQQFLGVALETVGAGSAVSILEQGGVWGFTLTSLNYGARVYLSDTVGTYDDSTGTMAVIVGQVRPITTLGGFNKYLFVSSDPTKVWA
jgi:predicted RecA/RadA family phage recombinase